MTEKVLDMADLFGGSLNTLRTSSHLGDKIVRQKQALSIDVAGLKHHE